MPFFLIPLLIAVGLRIISYLIQPKPKASKPDAAKDAENPTAEAGREIPVLFGTLTIKGPNVLDFGDKSIRTYQVKA